MGAGRGGFSSVRRRFPRTEMPRIAGPMRNFSMNCGSHRWCWSRAHRGLTRGLIGGSSFHQLLISCSSGVHHALIRPSSAPTTHLVLHGCELHARAREVVAHNDDLPPEGSLGGIRFIGGLPQRGIHRRQKRGCRRRDSNHPPSVEVGATGCAGTGGWGVESLLRSRRCRCRRSR